jgi:hypothetical protein
MTVGSLSNVYTSFRKAVYRGVAKELLLGDD